VSKTLLPLLILSLVACCIEIDISVPGFPDMARYFSVSDGMIQLTIAYNFLGFCLASVCYGPLSEAYGRRNVMVAGNALLLIGAALCVVAPNITLLLVARFIQGIGAATSAVVAFAMVADAYQGDKAVKFMGIMNSILTTLMAVAPVVGSFINEAVGWRGNYGIVALVCLISWILLLLMLPETRPTRERFSLSKVVADYKQLLASRHFMSASMVPSLLYAAYLTFVACGSFLYMETFGLSIIAYALHQGFIVATFSFVSIFVGRLIDKFGSQTCVNFGLTLVILGTLLLVALSIVAPNSPYLMTAFMSVVAVGDAIVYAIIFTASMEIFPGIRGTASSTIMAMRALVVSVAVGCISYLYDGQPLSVTLVMLCILICTLGFFAMIRNQRTDTRNQEQEA